MSPFHLFLSLSGNLVKLWQVWRERNTLGLLQFLYRRSVEMWHSQPDYQQWIRRDRLTQAEIRGAKRAIVNWSAQPTFSIIMPVSNVEASWLEPAIESVQHQIYPHWELCIAADAQPKPHIRQILTRYSERDDRLKVVFGSETELAARNDALALATGDYIALLGHNDELAIEALFEHAKLINQHPEADFIYSDEDKLDATGNRLDPFFKPEWSPDYFHACLYTGHLSVYRSSLIRALNGFQAGDDRAQAYDLALRVVEQTSQIYHIPKVLYHQRIVPASVTANELAPTPDTAVRQALEAMLARSSYPGWVEKLPDRPGWRVRRHIVGEPLISIIIPSAGALTPDGSCVALENCLRSIREHSTYRNFEVVLVDGYDIPDKTLTAVMSSSDGSTAANIRLVRCQEPFNFAHRMNQGAAHAKGTFLLLLNDDVEIITPDWLESMLELAQQEAIGAVGAKLLYPDGTLQHSGVVILEGGPAHTFHGVAGDHPGYFGSNVVNRNYLAVTAACLMVRTEFFHHVSGMDERFPLNYNDVDFCLKVHQAGYRNVVTPYAQLIHYESISRKPGLQPKEWETFKQKWKPYIDRLNGDPYYNPNLSQRAAIFERR